MDMLAYVHQFHGGGTFLFFFPRNLKTVIKYFIFLKLHGASALGMTLYRIWEEMLALHKYGRAGKEKKMKPMNH